MIKKVLLGLLVLLVIAQFIQPKLNEGDAASLADIHQVVNIPDSIKLLLQTACYDCHSNNTSYPWYSRITPVNWWLKGHIDEGKKHLNFTTYSNYDPKQKDHKLEEIAETVEDHSMPLNSYLWIHNDARLNDAQRKAIIDWTKRARAELNSESSMVMVNGQLP